MPAGGLATQVSWKRRHLQVEVMELVRNLSIGGSSAAIAVGDKRRFVANIATGKPVSFLWTFDLQHHHHLKTTLIGKEVSSSFPACSQSAHVAASVSFLFIFFFLSQSHRLPADPQVSYVPEEPGLLTIYLRAFNALHTQNVTQHIVVQQQLRTAVLYALPWDTFVNKLVTLKALVSPRGAPLDCLWDFGDGSSQARSSNTSMGHEYRHPGHYRLQVGVLPPADGKLPSCPKLLSTQCQRIFESLGFHAERKYKENNPLQSP